MSGIAVVRGTGELLDRLLTYAEAAEADGAQQTANDLRDAVDTIIGCTSAIKKLKDRKAASAVTNGHRESGG